MHSKAFTIGSFAAILVLCATAAAALPHDGTLTAEDVDIAVVDAPAVATDQSNSKQALQVTSNIRRAVIADKSLSTSAHNVKIVTTGNTITLRGPVMSVAEKGRVAALARQNAQGKGVLDQLTVKGA